MGTVLKNFNAAEIAANRPGDWYIPACGQLSLMYLNHTAINNALTKIGGQTITSNNYWSSSELDSSYGWYVSFYFGSVGSDNKNYYVIRVRFVRDIE